MDRLHQPLGDRLQHQPLRRRDLPQPGKIGPVQHAQVRVREQPPLKRPLAHPHDVRREVRKAEGVEPRPDSGVDLRLLAGEDKQLLDPVAGYGLVEDPLDLVRLVEMRLMGRERAVLAIATARPRQGQREVSAERNAAAHSSPDST